MLSIFLLICGKSRYSLLNMNADLIQEIVGNILKELNISFDSIAVEEREDMTHAEITSSMARRSSIHTKTL